MSARIVLEETGESSESGELDGLAAELLPPDRDIPSFLW
jgi:hypothetical protein